MPFIKQNNSTHEIFHYGRIVPPGHVYGNYAGFHFVARPVLYKGYLPCSARLSGGKNQPWGFLQDKALNAFILDAARAGKVRLQDYERPDYKAAHNEQKALKEAKELRESFAAGVIRKHHHRSTRSFNSDYMRYAAPEYRKLSEKIYDGVSVEFNRKQGYGGKSCTSKSICDYIEGVK